MDKLITMDGDQYLMVIPEDTAWKGIVENYPEYEKESFLCRRHNKYKVTLIDGKYAKGIRYQYLKQEKYGEARIEDGEVHLDMFYTGVLSFRPCLIPLNKQGEIISDEMKKLYCNGTRVTGGSCLFDGMFFMHGKNSLHLTTDYFEIGDTCLELEETVLPWMWWDGTLICMERVALFSGENFTQFISVFDPELLRKEEKE